MLLKKHLKRGPWSGRTAISIPPCSNFTSCWQNFSDTNIHEVEKFYERYDENKLYGDFIDFYGMSVNDSSLLPTAFAVYGKYKSNEISYGKGKKVIQNAVRNGQPNINVFTKYNLAYNYSKNSVSTKMPVDVFYNNHILERFLFLLCLKKYLKKTITNS